MERSELGDLLLEILPPDRSNSWAHPIGNAGASKAAGEEVSVEHSTSSLRKSAGPRYG